MSRKHTSTVWILLILTVASLMTMATPIAFSQDAVGKAAATISPAPFPSQISSAKRVFIAYREPDFSAGISGGPDRPYDSFYAAMKNWGHYELVLAPNAADLVFELRLIEPKQGPDQILITIRDPKSNVALWMFHQPIEMAFRSSSRDKNFELAMQFAMNQIAKLAGTAPAFPPPTPKTF
ncbi:MAG TPA: hypothetical protein VFB76_07355 [Candidatus Angelobacter sp.]|nr:hypothetical protein [Candidatus Angelobacter sp.]